MDEREFISEISGEVRSAYGQYIYFQPHELPFKIEVAEDIIKISRIALINLSKLDGKVSEMEESERAIFMKAFTLKESTSSSSIEGTRSTLDDIYMYEREKPSTESNIRDAQEVLNYKEALETGLEAIRSSNLINTELMHRMHRILLNGVRGASKSPGEFKKNQNAIGRGSDTLDTAKMVPAPPESVPYLIDNLIEYIRSEQDPITKIALVHYQFESIHPYRDGNGRIGRLLIILMLAAEGILSYPVIYPSSYFDAYRSEYIDRLFNVSAKDEFNEWFRFFINGLNRQALDSIHTIDVLKAYKRSLIAGSKNLAEHRMIELFFINPYFKVNDVADYCSVSHPTAMKMITEYVSNGILREITGKKRNMIYCADGVMDILRSKRY